MIPTAAYVDAGNTQVKWRAAAWVIVAYAFLLRLAYCSQVELLPEETYYWNYAQHLDIGYLDHPPLVAWLIRACTALCGDTEMGVRLGALCCAVVLSIFVHRLTKNLYGETSALVAVLMAQLLPFFFLSGVLMTPDAPLTAAWAGSLYFLERALNGRAAAWLWAGLALGMGLLAKYTIALVGAAALLYVVLDPRSRHWLKRWQPYAGAAIAFCVFMPVIVWNAQHDWASFAFQTSRRLAEAPRFSLHKLIGGAVVLITPTGVIAAGFACVRADVPPATWRFLRTALLLPLGLFLLFSVRHEIKLDWTGAPWIAVLPVISWRLVVAWQRRPSNGGVQGFKGNAWQRYAWPSTFAAMLLVVTVGVAYLTVGLPGAGYSTHMELSPVGWQAFARDMDRVVDTLRATGEAPLVVGMDRYATASELAFYSHDQAHAVATTSSAHVFGDVGLMYEQWFPYALLENRTIVVTAWSADALATARLGIYFDTLEPLASGDIMHRGRFVRRYYYRVGHRYHAPPGAALR